MRNPALWLDRQLGLKNHTIAHYAWVIIAIAGAVQMVGAAIRMAFGVLVDPLVQTFDWSPGTIGLAYALMSITAALASPVAGYLGNRFGARRTMIAGTGLFFIGMMWTSQVQQIWELYLAYGLVFGISQALLLVPIIPATEIPLSLMARQAPTCASPFTAPPPMTTHVALLGSPPPSEIRPGAVILMLPVGTAYDLDGILPPLYFCREEESFLISLDDGSILPLTTTTPILDVTDLDAKVISGKS